MNDLVSVPKVQTDDRLINQLQQNIILAISQIQNQITTTNSSVTALAALVAAGTVRSEVFVDTANGFGASGTAIPRFSVTNVNTGTSITYADSATNGASFTINQTGLYGMSFWWGSVFAGADANNILITKNQSNLTQASFNMPTTERLDLAGLEVPSGTFVSFLSTSAVALLNAGDIIRPNSAHAASTNARCGFRITQLNN